MSSIKSATGDGVSVSTYIVGYVLSLIATLTAYWLVVGTNFPKATVLGIIAALAVAQFVVQVVFFLHLGHEKGRRWKLIVFSFMLMVVLIVVVGSIWIMDNLNYHMLNSPQETNTYLHSQDGI